MTEEKSPPVPFDDSSIRWPFPLELVSPAGDPLDARRAARWVWFFLFLGLASRVARYILRFPLWEDECFLSANLLDHSYVDLLGPLKYEQVCPLGFLWIQLTAVKLLGFHEYSLRLFSFVFSVTGLFVFRHVAGRLLKGSVLVAAMAFFAVAYPGIRYAAEAKQYGADLFFSLLLTAIVVEWWRRPEQHRWLWGLAAIVPVAVVISYPVVFVGGAISLFVAWLLVTRGDRRGWLPWTIYNVAMLASFGLLFALSAANQSSETLAYMQRYWQAGFPPLAQPLKLATWLLVTHASDMLAYPFGGHNGGSSLTLLCVVVAVVALVRRRRFALIYLLLAPLTLTLVAAALHRYPYGQMVKFQIYMAPAFCMLAGSGAVLIALRLCGGARRSIALSPASDGWRKQDRPLVAVTVVCIVLALCAVGTTARDFWFPAKSAAVMRARDFARWFWFTAEFDGEVACMKSDLGLVFGAGEYDRGLSSMYLCNERIYSPRHARGAPLAMDRVNENHPLRCVEYRSTRFPHDDYDEAARGRWLARMQTQYDLIGRERFPFLLGERGNQPPRDLDYLEVYKFGPKKSVAGEGRRTVGR